MSQRTITAALRRDILRGTYPPGGRLPASRQLAKDLGTSRMTLQGAMAQLETEGLVIRKPGAGVFVVDLLVQPADQKVDLTFSQWGERLRHAPLLQRRANRGSELRSFATLFPYDVWRRLLNRYLSTDDAILHRYGSPAGYGPLREAIATRVARLRGIDCTPEQVIIVNGIQQALDLLARLLINPNDEIVVEDPGYVSAYRVFSVYGADLEPVPVDQNGLRVDAIPAGSRARLAFVTPANQFPRGGALSLKRRQGLLAWARQNNALIFEDDYDGELRYSGQPLAALQTLDRDGRVIYLGTFSKVLFPALRLGYVILPAALHEPFLHAKRLLDRGAPTLTQAAVADFVLEGHFDRHLKRLRQLYGRRHATLVDALHTHLGNRVRFTTTPAGLHVWLTLPGVTSEGVLVRRLYSRGLPVYPGSPYFLTPDGNTHLIFNFSEIEDETIEEAVAEMKAIVLTSERSPKL